MYTDRVLEEQALEPAGWHGATLALCTSRIWPCALCAAATRSGPAKPCGVLMPSPTPGLARPTSRRASPRPTPARDAPWRSIYAEEPAVSQAPRLEADQHASAACEAETSDHGPTFQARGADLAAQQARTGEHAPPWARHEQVPRQARPRRPARHRFFSSLIGGTGAGAGRRAAAAGAGTG